MWEGELIKGLLWGSKASVSLLLLISRFNLHSTVGAVSAATVLGGLVDNDAGDDEILNVQALGLQHIPKYIYIFFDLLFFLSFTSALASAFFKRSTMYLTDLTGQRPWVVLNSLAWAVRPTPPLKRRKGMHCFFSVTFFK